MNLLPVRLTCSLSASLLSVIRHFKGLNVIQCMFGLYQQIVVQVCFLNFF